jgi:hypothetical protein
MGRTCTGAGVLTLAPAEVVVDDGVPPAVVVVVGAGVTGTLVPVDEPLRPTQT